LTHCESGAKPELEQSGGGLIVGNLDSFGWVGVVGYFRLVGDACDICKDLSF